MTLRIKRVYEPRAAADGYRVLVDQLWPRGITREKAGIDEWLKDIAPSRQTRQLFNHDPARWADFLRNYYDELDARRDQVEHLIEKARKRRVTLLYGAKNTTRNNAVALKRYIEQMHPHI